MTVQLVVQAKDGGGNVVNRPAPVVQQRQSGPWRRQPAGLITAQRDRQDEHQRSPPARHRIGGSRVRRKVASISVTPTTRTLAPNQTQALTVRALDALGIEITGAATPSFESSNTGAATVDGAGTVTAVATGSATITVRVTTVDGTRTATSEITGAPDLPSAETVILGAFELFSQNVDIAVNGTVTWNNTSGVEHNVTFAAPAITDIPNHLAGSNSRTFSTAGNFGYACTIHPGMSGSVIVH